MGEGEIHMSPASSVLNTASNPSSLSSHPSHSSISSSSSSRSSPSRDLLGRSRRRRNVSMESQQRLGERRYASVLAAQHQPTEEDIRRSDHHNMALLILLYMLQGVPMGLVMGSVPFLLQDKLTYTEQGILSIAGYPYALKLFWSPVVDACYSPRLGRRKSWIIPIQLLAGSLMFIIGVHVEETFAQPEIPIYYVTLSFLSLIMLVATQDIAVDGWALTLLSKPRRGWASTCQTIGLNSGFFLSFTIFLALNSAEFCNKYLRSEPQPEGLLSLSTYIKTWAIIFLVVTFYLTFFKDEKPLFLRTTAVTPTRRDNIDASQQYGGNGKSSYLMVDHGEKDAQTREYDRRRNQQKERDEYFNQRMMGATSVISEDTDDKYDTEDEDEDVTIKEVFWRIWKLVNLPNMRTLLLVLLVYKLGFMAADTVSALKLIEKGFKKEDMALFVLIEFPFQILFAVLAGRWASGSAPLSSFMIGFKLRLIIAALGAVVIYFYPADGVTMLYYMIVLSITLSTSFAGTIQFVSQGAFFTRISDLSIGGTYLTMLNTFANLGGTWPKFFTLWLVDIFTIKQCIGEGDQIAQVGSCVAKESADSCAALGGLCVTLMDGFYPVAFGCFLVGILLCFLLQRRLVPLERLSESAWKFKQ